MQSRTRDSRWLALVVLCAGMLMVILDQTIVNVALPSIQEDLGFSASGLAWVINAYLIAFGGLLLLAGRLGDLIGRRTIFLTGLAVFTLASLLCGLSGSPEMLIAARFVQGVGGALSSAVILGMIVTMFPEPGEQGKAIGVFSFVASAGASIGLLAGGVLTQALDWHWIFFVNVPIGVAAAFFGSRWIEHEDGLGLSAGADVPGAVLVTSALMLGVYTIVDARSYALGAIAVVLLALFVWRQATAERPLLRAAHPALAQRRRREPRPDADDRRHARRVLPRRPLPAARARLRRGPHRRGVPADLAVDRRALARASRPA